MASINGYGMSEDVAITRFYDAALSGSQVVQNYNANCATFGLAAITPEPSTIVILTTGLVALLAYAWRKRR